MIDSAQDAEMILDTVEDGDQVGAMDRSHSEGEDTARESTWKGCDSDDEFDAGIPRTSDRDIKVVIYAPSETWIPSDAQANSQPSPPLRDAIQEANDDNHSVFSMTHYDLLDWDHTGDESDEVEVTPKTTRRSSAASPNNQTAVPSETHEPDPVTPRNKRSSTSSASTSEKKTVSLQRDSKGRFAPKNSSSASSQSSGSVKTKLRRASMILNSTNSSVVRDSHGRFAPKGTPTNTTAKRRASVGSSALEKAPRSLQRDSKGRFALKETPIPPPKSLAQRRASTSVIPDKKPLVIIRDEKGKFAPKQTTVPPPQRPNLAQNLENSLPVVAEDGNDRPKPNPGSRPAKANKAPAKSPYFASPIPPTPPISPEITQKSQRQKAKRAEQLEAPIIPQKNNEAPPASQGSGKKLSPGKMVSCIPFPPLSAPHFGLIQEKLAHDPFRLLIAVTFLIRTHGKHAIPVFFDLMEKYPTPESLVAADKEEIVPIIRHLGLQNQRASTYQMYAKIWLENPPAKDKRYAVRGYPNPESGRDVKKGETISDDDERDAWEIGHMTQGPYAIDSWRIFCRDKLRGEADGWNGEGRGSGFQPEWMRVVPEDKELRAYLRWMWLKEGFEWDPFTGDKEVARPELMRAAMEGRIVWDDQGGMRILNEPMIASPAKSDTDTDLSQVSTSRVGDSEDSENDLA